MQDLNHEIVTRLIEQYQCKDRGEHLREGRCPSCEKKTIWTWKDKPGMVQCNRVNQCAWAATTKDLFPDLFENLNKRYQPTPENPNATADAYMSLVRGFEPGKIKGWYEQGKFWHPRSDKGTATVRFWLDAGKTVMWERLIEDVTIVDEDGDLEVRNKNFRGSFKGLWWEPPGLQIGTGDQVWLCEGILDAIALSLSGIKAVAIMSSGTFPSARIDEYRGRKILWILALDNDKAGLSALRKHAKRLRDMNERVGAALPSESRIKEDWNDLHQKGRITEEDVDRYLHYGILELSRDALEKAFNIWDFDQRAYFVFTLSARTYSAKVDSEEYSKAREKLHESGRFSGETVKMEAFRAASKVREIGTFKMDFLYYEKPANGECGLYFFRVLYSNRSPEELIAVNGKCFGAAADFKKTLLVYPGAQFTGSTFDLDYLYNQWLSNIPKIVKTLDYVGYDPDTGAYVYPEFAVEKDRVLELNAEGFFQLRRGGIKSKVEYKQRLVQSRAVEWFEDYRSAFGIGGLVVLGWWFGCLFVEQIRRTQRNYPFMELVGEPASGKTDMVDFLWKLLGRDGESFNPNTSTLPGRTRKMAEVSNMPVVFNETDNEDPAQDRHNKKFNWDEQKDLYDGEFGRITGIKSQDNSTRKPTFKAGLMVVQNIPVYASDAILSRIVHVQFDRVHHSPAGKAASDRLNMRAIIDVSGFLLNAATQAETVLQKFSRLFPKFLDRLQRDPEIKLQRIADNHAKIMALASCLNLVVPISDQEIHDVQLQIQAMASARQQVLEQDHPVVQQFWATFDYLDSRPLAEGHYSSPVIDENILNHSNHPTVEIAVNLEHFNCRCAESKLETIPSRDLRKFLPGSRQRLFVEKRMVRSRIEGRALRCWIFKRGG